MPFKFNPFAKKLDYYQKAGGLDISALDEVTALDVGADYIVIYDADAGVNKKVLIENLPKAAFTDNFDDDDIYWGWETDGIGANKTIVEAGNVITLSCTGGATDARWQQGTNVAPKIFTGAPGFPLEIIAKLNDFTVNNDVSAGIFIAVEPNGIGEQTEYGIGRLKSAIEGVDGLAVWHEDNEAIASNAVTTLPIWLRIRVIAHGFNGCKVILGYSTDGSSYTDLHTFDDFSSVHLADEYSFFIGVYGKNLNAAAAFAAPFEFFTATQDSGPR